jgi:hypothetical protein
VNRRFAAFATSKVWGVGGVVVVVLTRGLYIRGGIERKSEVEVRENQR